MISKPVKIDYCNYGSHEFCDCCSCCAIEQSAFYREQEIKEIKDKYYELIMAVGNKYDGETRHQTALRYIKTAESSSDEQEKEAS